MKSLDMIIDKIRRELNELVLSGMPLDNPIVIKKSQELDKYITAYYREKDLQHKAAKADSL